MGKKGPEGFADKLDNKNQPEEEVKTEENAQDESTSDEKEDDKNTELNKKIDKLESLILAQNKQIEELKSGKKEKSEDKKEEEPEKKKSFKNMTDEEIEAYMERIANKSTQQGFDAATRQLTIKSLTEAEKEYLEDLYADREGGLKGVSLQELETNITIMKKHKVVSGGSEDTEKVVPVQLGLGGGNIYTAKSKKVQSLADETLAEYNGGRVKIQ